MYHEMAGTKSPVRMWIDPTDVEWTALNQIRTVADMPWVEGLAVMPDVHAGKGATIGTVIASRNAVCPAAVGVDIGCVDADSEYLSPQGWRRIADYTGGPVMQYDPETSRGQFVEPSRFVVRDCPEFLWLRTKYGIDQMLSPDHRMLVWRMVGRDRRRVQEVLLAEQFEAEHTRLKVGIKAEFETSFEPEIETELPLSDEQIRVQVMVHADAHLDGRRAVLRLKKQRKIDRAEQLFAASGVDASRSESGGVTTFRFAPPRLTKSFSGDWWEASWEQLAVIAEECLLWDGNAEDRCFYTRDRASADFMHYVFTAVGFRAVLREDKSEDDTLDFRVFAQPNRRVTMMGTPKSEIVRVPSADGRAYCFTVPSGFWVMRRGGNIVMTGNCGMNAVPVTMEIDQLPDDLGPLRAAIEAAVPVGQSSHTTYLGTDGRMQASRIGGWSGFFASYDNLSVGKMTTRRLSASDYTDRVMNQIGTLGGGNHFVEVCKDESDQIWLMLHSGSRNVGKELAERHIEVAAALPQNQDVPDRHLAAFFLGTPEMDAYRNDLMWAQDYAFRNRAVMMGLVKKAFTEITGISKFGSEINCHHNYVSEETYDGKDMIVTRKGAISTRDGRLGVIPGSMGTGSFIVQGLANEDSYCSASHGAGRRMSRGEARRTFTEADLVEQTAGVECRKDAGIVDEIPAAYKDLAAVMANQTDLVRPIAKLDTLLCVKG
ncbi:MAG: RtcB family protein [Candidatus Nanopelagicales bacterium]